MVVNVKLFGTSNLSSPRIFAHTPRIGTSHVELKTSDLSNLEYSPPPPLEFLREKLDNIGVVYAVHRKVTVSLQKVTQRKRINGFEKSTHSHVCVVFILTIAAPHIFFF